MEVTLKIFRFDPGVNAIPYYRKYTLAWSDGFTLLAAIRQIYAEQDGTLAFRNYFCGRGLCAGCRVTVDGGVKKACHVLLEPGREYLVEPLKDYPVIRDLVVDFGIRRSLEDKTYEIRQGTCL
ncbi:MAG: 2Fe-2S iron-sulfur cluster-binding protein [Negativicutes bacterium]|nr:2Fe-2S iron-sulfur cluster-binding protein [Negativicutes bacterium]